MLFQTFIPRTWSLMLEELVSRGLVSDVFTFWPPERSSGELECYYAPLSEQLVHTLVAANAAVWPVYEFQNQFRSIKALVVAPPTERVCVLQALASVGISLTRPPKYIFEHLSNLSENVSILDPKVAHKLLLVCLSCLYPVSFLTGTGIRTKWRRSLKHLRRSKGCCWTTCFLLKMCQTSATFL